MTHAAQHFLFFSKHFLSKERTRAKTFLQAKTFTKNNGFFAQAFFSKERLLLKLFYKPLQFFQISPSCKPFQGFRGCGRSPRCGSTGGARNGAEPHTLLRKDENGNE